MNTLQNNTFVQLKHRSRALQKKSAHFLLFKKQRKLIVVVYLCPASAILVSHVCQSLSDLHLTVSFCIFMNDSLGTYRLRGAPTVSNFLELC